MLGAALWTGLRAGDRPGALSGATGHRRCPGDLLGAFDGQVVDAQSGKPLAGAIVQASWAFEIGRGLTAPAGGAVATVATDNDGRYLVERLCDLPSARARIAGVTLVVYERGYVAYRSDRVFDNALGGARARSDFSQHNNDVKLERWSSALSHVKHVRFVGGSGALKRALGSEVVEASLELTAGPLKPSDDRPPPAPKAAAARRLRAAVGRRAARRHRLRGRLHRRASSPICRRRRATTAATSRPSASPRPSTQPSACGS